MKKLALLTTLFLLLSSSADLLAQGYCIKYKNSRLSVKTTSNKSCPSGQAFIPTVAGETGATGAQGATGATGPTGPQGAAGATGPQGPAGSAGANGSARAYGFVSSAGNINTAKSSSNVSARKVATGVYCISASGINPSTVMPVVSADQDDGSGSYHLAQVKSLFGGSVGCTASEWAVNTSNYTSSFANTDVAFSFIVP